MKQIHEAPLVGAIVPMRSEERRPFRISCADPDWLLMTKRHIADGEEIDLVSFNSEYDSESCGKLALQHGLEFKTMAEYRFACFRRAN